MLVAIPSKGRAGATKSDQLLKGGVLFVPKSEEHQYKAVAKNVVPVPNTVRGITATRNWILKESGERWVVFVDDDVKKQGWHKLLSGKSQHVPMTERQWMETFDRLFLVVESLGYKIWGVDTYGAPWSVFPFNPIRFRSYVTASCMGMVNDGTMYFDEAFPVKEDYEICLRHIKQFGGILAARYCFWQNSHWGDDGGCKDYRTQTMEQKCILELMKRYPGMIRKIERGGSGYSISLDF